MDDPTDATGAWPGIDADAPSIVPSDGTIDLDGLGVGPAHATIDGAGGPDPDEARSGGPGWGPDKSGAPDPAAILRLAMLGWGLGHVALGMRRAGLLLALEALWLAALVAALAVLATDAWLLIFGLFVGFILVWTGQAVDAHRRASRRAGRDPGAMQLIVIPAVAMLVLTGYWVLGGATAGPEATLQRYVSAWETNQPERAAVLFATPHDPSGVADQWALDTAAIAAHVNELAEQHDEWDLDTLRPYRDLRFAPVARRPGSGRADYVVQVVRQAQVATTFLGLPATRSETQVIDVVGSLSIVERASGAALPLTGQPNVWLIEDVHIGS